MEHNRTQTFTDKTGAHGEVYRQSFSGSKLKEALEKKTGLNFDSCYTGYVDGKGIIDFDVLMQLALESGIAKSELKRIVVSYTKYQFADNFIWRFLRRKYSLDVAIPFITGIYTKRALKANLIVNTGHKIYADLAGGTNTQGAVTAMAYGTGTTAAAAADLALQTEVARAAATITNTTTSTTGDTEQWVHTFTAGGTQAVTEEGLLDNNTTGGHLLSHQVFSAINQVINDTVQFTHKIQS